MERTLAGIIRVRKELCETAGDRIEAARWDHVAGKRSTHQCASRGIGRRSDKRIIDQALRAGGVHTCREVAPTFTRGRHRLRVAVWRVDPPVFDGEEVEQLVLDDR